MASVQGPGLTAVSRAQACHFPSLPLRRCGGCPAEPARVGRGAALGGVAQTRHEISASCSDSHKLSRN